MSTVKEAVDLMNEKHVHPAGFHLTMVRKDLLPATHSCSDAPHHLLQQTYDWRYGKPDKEKYSVTLSADDMEYIGNALEIYGSILFELYTRPELEKIVKGMCQSE